MVVWRTVRRGNRRYNHNRTKLMENKSERLGKRPKGAGTRELTNAVLAILNAMVVLEEEQCRGTGGRRTNQSPTKLGDCVALVCFVVASVGLRLTPTSPFEVAA
ncbi:hypothetical protein P691DRAFT_784901 [Macrolepiota fuliginosa MF-IS2]|uniref:Uncharacterized protein n=1 Tax=Macrolepiota fuliginosa MF-IS2 TaxID=1400762 RepID=A0A9P6C1I8_9AGAR|nr:hypothetical protein P691DRAFT_784901 [Macrolepiota fuliginosa MF-IS2]